MLGMPGLNKKEMVFRKSAIDFCTVIPLTTRIKNEAILLKQEYIKFNYPMPLLPLQH